jgi:multidrug efflux pump subunit AcrB
VAVILSLFASYLVAMTVVPLFCAKLIKAIRSTTEVGHSEIGQRSQHGLACTLQPLVQS